MQAGQQHSRTHILFGRNYGQQPTGIVDTATTTKHHDESKVSGRTLLDAQKIDREIQRLTNKDDYEAHYYDSL